MNVYSIGQDDFVDTWGIAPFRGRGGLDVANMVWLIHWYHEVDSEGQGEMVAMGKDGLLRIYNISNCHGCYPIDWEKQPLMLTPEQYVDEDPEDRNDWYCAEGSVAVKAAVRLMIAGQAPANRTPYFYAHPSDDEETTD